MKPEDIRLKMIDYDVRLNKQTFNILHNTFWRTIQRALKINEQIGTEKTIIKIQDFFKFIPRCTLDNSYSYLMHLTEHQKTLLQETSKDIEVLKRTPNNVTLKHENQIYTLNLIPNIATNLAKFILLIKLQIINKLRYLEDYQLYANIPVQVLDPQTLQVIKETTIREIATKNGFNKNYVTKVTKQNSEKLQKVNSKIRLKRVYSVIPIFKDRDNVEILQDCIQSFGDFSNNQIKTDYGVFRNRAYFAKYLEAVFGKPQYLKKYKWSFLK